MNDENQPRETVETHKLPWGQYLPILGKWVWRGICGAKHFLLGILAALVSVVVFISPELVPGCREIGLRWFGAGLQLLGFATVAVGLRGAGKQFGRPTLRQRVVNYFSAFPQRTVRNINLQLSITEGVDFFGGGRGFVSPNPSTPHDEQLKQIWEKLKGLHKLVSEVETSVVNAKNELSTQITERFNELKEGEKQIKRQFEEAFVGGLHIEWWGIVLFVVGVMLASTSPEVAYLFGFPPGCY